MLFIYWGWDTSVSVNEETANKHVFPGRAAVISTLVLLVVYEFVVLATQSYAGLAQPASPREPGPPGGTSCRPWAALYSAPPGLATSSPTSCCSWC